MHRTPLVGIAAALVLGTMAALPLAAEQRVLVVFGLTTLCAWLWVDRGASHAFRGALVLALVCGYGSSTYRTAHTSAVLETRTQRFSGSVLTCATTASATTNCTIELDDGRRVLAFLRERPAVGDRLLVRARLEPFDVPRNPGEPDERVLQAERGLSGTLASATVIRHLEKSHFRFSVFLAELRARAGERLRASLEEPYASIVAGELWGERSAIPPDLRAEFQDTGTVHILVTAGLHLGVVALLAIGVLQSLRVARVPSCAIACALVWAYALFSDAHLPAVRAASMATFALGARAFGAKAVSWNALAFAAIIAVLERPQSVLTPSFAMSFSCVAAILLVVPLIAEPLERLTVLPAVARESFALTVATQVGVWPLTAATFLLFAPYAVFANALVVPAVGVTMLLGMLQIAASPLLPLAVALGNLNAWILSWMVGIVGLASQLPHAHVVVTPPSALAITCYDVAIFFAVWLIRRQAHTAAAVVLAVCAGVGFFSARAPAGTLRVTVLDVGQADAILIQTPQERAVLVDAGGRLERGAQTAADSTAEHVGESVVVPFLIRAGIHHLDAVLLSHPHGDHAGGIAPTLRILGAAAFGDTGQRYGGFAYQDALSVARASATRMVHPRAGTIWRTDDGVTLSFYWPQERFITGSRNDINNNSFVFMLQYKSFRMLFTGDAGSEAEQRILSEGVDLHADVLKVGHHGSAYSSTPGFIDAVHPKYAVISVGRHNLFGHPAPSTVTTLQEAGATVYRTDDNGAITVTSSGEGEGIAVMLYGAPVSVQYGEPHDR